MQLNVTLKAASEQCKQWQQQSETVVFTNGCFDLLHPGHIQYLEDARALGDRLIIGLNSDASIERLKGSTRPINPVLDRACMLAALKSVDLVTVFEEDTPLHLISSLLPNVLVKGGDYQPDEIVGAEAVRSAGGKVVVVTFLPGYSSSKLIRRIKQ